MHGEVTDPVSAVIWSCNDTTGRLSTGTVARRSVDDGSAEARTASIEFSSSPLFADASDIPINLLPKGTRSKLRDGTKSERALATGGAGNGLPRTTPDIVDGKLGECDGRVCCDNSHRSRDLMLLIVSERSITGIGEGHPGLLGFATGDEETEGRGRMEGEVGSGTGWSLERTETGVGSGRVVRPFRIGVDV